MEMRVRKCLGILFYVAALSAKMLPKLNLARQSHITLAQHKLVLGIRLHHPYTAFNLPFVGNYRRRQQCGPSLPSVDYFCTEDHRSIQKDMLGDTTEH